MLGTSVARTWQLLRSDTTKHLSHQVLSAPPSVTGQCIWRSQPSHNTVVPRVQLLSLLLGISNTLSLLQGLLQRA